MSAPRPSCNRRLTPSAHRVPACAAPSRAPRRASPRSRSNRRLRGPRAKRPSLILSARRQRATARTPRPGTTRGRAHGSRRIARAAPGGARIRRRTALAELTRRNARPQPNCTPRLEVERQSGTALQLQLEAERAAAAELRLAAGRATERVTELGATLGRETSEGKAAHEELSSELARQRDVAALLQKALADGHLALAAARTDLEIERTSSAGLRQAVESADQQLATRPKQRHAGAGEPRTGDGRARSVTRGRRIGGRARRRWTWGTRGRMRCVQRELGAERDNLRVERASNADLRQALEFADHQLAGARSSETQTLADHVQLAAELDKLRAELDADRTSRRAHGRTGRGRRGARGHAQVDRRPARSGSRVRILSGRRLLDATTAPSSMHKRRHPRRS